MGWLSKFFKGSSYKGQHHVRYAEDRYWEEPCRSVDDSSDFDRDEIACALALSLSEIDYKGKKVIEEDGDSNLSDEDVGEVERIARAEEEERRARAEEEERRVRAAEEERCARAEEEEKRARAVEEERRARAEEDEKRLRAQLEEDE